MATRIIIGDVREQLALLPAESVHCVVTSPPYWGLRDYGVAGQIGLEPTPAEFVAAMVGVFREVKRVLRADGTLWLNLGDSYAGSGRGGNPTAASSTLQGSTESQEAAMIKRTRDDVSGAQRERCPAAGERTPPELKNKDLCGMPWRVAFALQADGWYLRQDIIWAKPNPMPESVTDRCTKSHEYLFLLSKSEQYYFDQDSILEPASPNTHARLSQDVQNQVGSSRVPGKTNGTMKAVGRKLATPGSGTKNNSSFDAAMAIMPTMRNKRDVWTVSTQPFKEAHFATFPPALIEPCILAGSPGGGCGA